MTDAYYGAYEERYRALQATGGGVWGHSPDSGWLRREISAWVTENGLSGKQVIEFACGEGAGGVMLTDMGCIYHGVDLAPSALKKASELLEGRKNATLSRMDMVTERPAENFYHAALDMSGLHMLVTDEHRARYLANVYAALKRGGTALFMQESYRENAYEGAVDSIEQWAEITGLDFTTPEARDFGGKTVMLKLLPARPRTADGYRREFERAGFRVEYVRPIEDKNFMPASAAILVYKP